MPPDIIAAYFTVYFLFPRFLLKNKYTKFFIYFTISAFALAFLQRALLYYGTYQIYYPDSVSASAGFFKFNILYSIFNIYPVVGVVATVKLLKSWFQNQQKTQTLEKEKMEAELKFLKAQIHPHFLFNTLNNLYALTLDKSDQAPEVVIKLSNLLDYMLYECNTPKVAVDKEINIIKNYLSLEQIRYGKELNIKFTKKGSTKNLEIAPMILLPFIENSFKHGLSKNTKDPWIDISINFSGNNLLFNVQNNKIKGELPHSDDYTEGIGLKNVQRRLELIYNKRHDLLISDKGETFDIFLKIEL
ncbi:sensor histidine kinase [Bacteroidota bacterium]